MKTDVTYRVLIIDDDVDLASIISDMLESYGYAVSSAKCADEAYEMLTHNTYHIILLDINLPDSDGFTICKEIREKSTTPIIFASARTSETDRIVGFDTGGDDYLPKPYSMKELLSRINALIRRTYGFNSQEKIVCFGDVKVNMSSRTVQRKGEVVSLSLREFDLLAYLCEHKNVAVEKDKILAEVWGAFSIVEPSTLTVHIRWLREKLEKDPANPEYIKTKHRLGYMLEVPDES